MGPEDAAASRGAPDRHPVSTLDSKRFEIDYGVVSFTHFFATRKSNNFFTRKYRRNCKRLRYLNFGHSVADCTATTEPTPCVLGVPVCGEVTDKTALRTTPYHASYV